MQASHLPEQQEYSLPLNILRAEDKFVLILEAGKLRRRLGTGKPIGCVHDRISAESTFVFRRQTVETQAAGTVKP